VQSEFRRPCVHRWQGADNTCLTAPQLKTVETYYGGVKNSKGELIFSGQALGNAMRAQQPPANGPSGGTFDLVRLPTTMPISTGTTSISIEI
jgi:hypothetical protein